MRASAMFRGKTFGRQIGLGASWLWGVDRVGGPSPLKPAAHLQCRQEEIKADAQGLMGLRLISLRSLHGPLMTMGISSLTPAREAIYTEQKQALDIKPREFYEREATEFHRYFYYVDLQGRLYLEDTLPKTAATCLKAPKAINAFFKALQHNNTGHHSEYPYVSPCGHWETNYIKAAAVPVVFTDLIRQHVKASQPLPSSEDTEGDDDVLCYAVGLTAPFDPRELRVCPRTGMLFHRLRVAAWTPWASFARSWRRSSAPRSTSLMMPVTRQLLTMTMTMISDMATRAAER